MKLFGQNQQILLQNEDMAIGNSFTYFLKIIFLYSILFVGVVSSIILLINLFLSSLDILLSICICSNDNLLILLISSLLNLFLRFLKGIHHA